MIQTFTMKSEKGFTLMELLVSILVLLPVMAAAVSLFSLGAKQHSQGQSGIDANQEARVALAIMATELSQAGSHSDVSTTALEQINPSVTAQSIRVASTAGFTIGDDIDVGEEIVQLTGVSSSALTGVFRYSHTPNTPVNLSAMPYPTGVIPPTGMAANSSLSVTTLRFFGHIRGNNSDPTQNDPTIQYVEYVYDGTNNQITRSATPVTQTAKNPAVSFVRNLRPNSVQFTLNTDSVGVVTAVSVAMVTRSSVKTGSSQYQETPLFSRISIPSTITGSALLREYQLYRGLYKLPPTPPVISTWASTTVTSQ